MKISRNNVMVAASLVGFFAVAAPVATASAAPRAFGTAAGADDESLEKRIAADLKKDSTLAPRDIDVDVKEGRVTLTGTVRTTAERTRAAHVANVSGVVSVINNIEVDPKIDQSKVDAAADKTKSGVNKAVDATAHAAEKTKEGVEKGVGKSEEGVGKAADSTADALHKTSAKMSDAAITTKVKSRMTDESLLKDSAIDVDTSNHVVTLKGTVASSVAKTRAGTIASGTDGVTRVNNQLVVSEDK